MVHSLVSLAGTLFLATTAYKFARLAYIYFVRPSSLPRYHHGTGPLAPWALVTGATDGIGFGLAQELCSRGFNVILHGRSQPKLDAKAAELTAAFPRRAVKTWRANALTPGPSPAYAALADLIRSDNLNLTVLINNIGGADPVVDGAYKTFAASTTEDIHGMVQFNAGFALHVTRAVLPVMLQNTPCLVMNIGSHSDFGTPYVATYAASKAFLMAFSVSLRAEMQGEGLAGDVEVIGVVSGETVSATTRKPVSWTIPSARTFARCALDRVGCGRSVISAYYVHGLQRGFLNALPESWARGLLVKTISTLREARRNGQWKKQ